MLNKLPQLQETLTPNCVNPTETVELINSYIEKNTCENMTVDISLMNVLDTCYVTTLCSTKHYIKYPQGKIKWIVSSKEISNLNKDLELGNSEYIL